MVPTLLVVLGAAGAMDAAIETEILQIYAQAGSYAESILGGVRTVQAFSLGPRVLAKYDAHLQDAHTPGLKKNKLYGVVFGGQYFVVYAGMGLAFWQGIAMLERGEISDSSAALTSFSPLLYRQQVALVQQEPTLFPGTIRENILHGVLERVETETGSDEVLAEACRAANAWDFVCSLPEGLDTPCGTGGGPPTLDGARRRPHLCLPPMARLSRPGPTASWWQREVCMPGDVRGSKAGQRCLNFFGTFI